MENSQEIEQEQMESTAPSKLQLPAKYGTQAFCQKREYVVLCNTVGRSNWARLTLMELKHQYTPGQAQEHAGLWAQCPYDIDHCCTKIKH